MDLGIKGRRALVCASSKGLGRGCAEALAAEGVNLVLNARGSEALEATAEAIRVEYGVDGAGRSTLSSGPNRYFSHQCGRASAGYVDRLEPR